MDTKRIPSEILGQQLAAKKAWRKKQAALPMSEKVKILEKLRAQNRAFKLIRKRRANS
ncbi:MAG TPA: hypothetical protein VK673_16660 [Chthoniobacterales bacterium]|nr:hypothetical protein [Chthoniobacterales bacterium]